MPNWTTWTASKGLQILVGVVMTLTGTASSATDFKLHINKSQSVNNVIVFKDSLNASVVHTSEGMELIIPGVDVQMRCKSNAEGATGSCTIAVEAQAATNTPTTNTPTTNTPTTNTPTNNGDCISGTWSNCDDGNNNDPAPTNPPTSTPPTTTDPGAGGSGNCSNTSIIACGNLNLGSGGANVNLNNELVIISPGRTNSYAFNAASGKYYGTVDFIPTNEQNPDGYELKVWLSNEAGGAPINNTTCVRNVGYEGTIKWDQTGNKPFPYCPLPAGASAASYFLNFAVCDSAASDHTCSTGTRADSKTYLYVGGSSVQ